MVVTPEVPLGTGSHGPAAWFGARVMGAPDWHFGDREQSSRSHGGRPRFSAADPPMTFTCQRSHNSCCIRAEGRTMTKQLDHQALVDFTRRWFTLWTEADPQARSKQVVDLWATNGAQVLVDPPQAMQEAATELAFPVPRLEVRGHDEIDRRVTRAYTMFVEPGVHTFTAAGDAVLLAPGLLGLGWDMVAGAGGALARS